jgi:hypothetical protein
MQTQTQNTMQEFITNYKQSLQNYNSNNTNENYAKSFGMLHTFMVEKNSDYTILVRGKKAMIETKKKLLQLTNIEILEENAKFEEIFTFAYNNLLIMEYNDEYHPKAIRVYGNKEEVKQLKKTLKTM